MPPHPYSLNHTERKAYEWLTDQHAPDEIERDGRRACPDFQTPDGPYEAKRLNSNSVQVSEQQAQALGRTNPTILVFQDGVDEPVSDFEWVNRDIAPLPVTVRDTSNTSRVSVAVPDQTLVEWKRAAACYESEEAMVEDFLRAFNASVRTFNPDYSPN